MEIYRKQFEEVNDINALVKKIVFILIQAMLNDEIWQFYGYKSRPRHGGIWDKLFPNFFKFENYVRDKIIILGLVDILNGIKKTNADIDTKIIISFGVIDQILTILDNTMSEEKLMRDLFSAYSVYLTSETSKRHEPIIKEAQQQLNRKDFLKFMYGTIKLLALSRNEDYLLKSEHIKHMIENSRKENKLSFAGSQELSKKYADLVEEKIFNS